MHRTLRPESLLLLAVVAWGGGCGTETGNPDGTMVDLGYNARTSRPDDVGFEPTARVQVDAVWLRLADAHLDVSCPGDPLRFDGIGLADHAGKTAAWQELAPEEGQGAVGYCGVGTWARRVDDGSDDPPDVDGASIAITGWLEDGRRFAYQVHQDIDLAVAVDPETDPGEAPWLMTFDVASWLDADDLEALDDDELQFDDSSPLGRQMRERLLDGVQLHQDFDRDGVIDRGDPRIDR